MDVAIPSIAQNCKKLRRLALKNFEEAHHEELEGLCISLGGQLKSLTFTHCAIDHVRLARICAACINASLELREVRCCTPAALRAIGDRASVVNIGPDTLKDYENHLELESLRQAGEQCKNLTAIWQNDRIPGAPFRAFFNHPKPLLVKFVGELPPQRDIKYIFEALANNVSSLEEFDFTGILPQKAVLREFVEGNPLLKSVKFVNLELNCDCSGLQAATLNVDGGDWDSRMDVKTAAEIFLESEKLESLSIACVGMHGCEDKEYVKRNEEYANVCVDAQLRNISVVMCGYRYS